MTKNHVLAPVGYCSWCGKPLHLTPDSQFPDLLTYWCECGWWDALPEKFEEEFKAKETND